MTYSAARSGCHWFLAFLAAIVLLASGCHRTSPGRTIDPGNPSCDTAPDACHYTLADNQPYCGDGIVQVTLGEECDDGNTLAGDGCSGTCAVEPNWDCPPEGGACVWGPICGNGTREAGEECDDGNPDDGDGCSASCVIEAGFYCLPPTAAGVGQVCLRLSSCGDGELDQGEQCDTGLANGSGGCDSNCRVIAGWRCATANEACTELPICGNGTVEPGEECDDGKLPPVSGDGCSDRCRIESDYWTCPSTGGACTSSIACGNGKVEPNEECDDGQNPPRDGDGCSATCQIEAGYVCLPHVTGAVGQVCRKLPRCGDGKLDQGEQCDTGALNGTGGCDLTCHVLAGWRCPVPNQACVLLPVCGNGTVEPLEQCDDGQLPPASGDGCSDKCRIESDYWSCAPTGGACVSTIACGNGRVEPGEECDDGQSPPADGDGCSATCQIEPGWFCQPRIPGDPGQVCLRLPSCGDDVVQQGEECDTGALNGTGGCTTSCRVLPGWRCLTAGAPCVRLPVCGNGVVETGEECDDGILPPVSGDGCSNKCRVESSTWTCPPTGGACVSTLVCGNGKVEPGEQCDDGQLPPVSGDGCSATCQLEQGWRCSVPGKKCRPVCGDGVLAGNETCDFGATVNPGCAHCQVQSGYYCTDTLGTISASNPPHVVSCVPGPPNLRLLKVVCGNGATEPGEGCDDGAAGVLVSGDGCTPTCQREPTCARGADGVCVFPPTCGNGVVEAGEACDDGNLTNGDGCAATCQVEPGYTCVTTKSYPASLTFPFVHRDFKAVQHACDTTDPATTTTRHPDFGRGCNAGIHAPASQVGIPGIVCTVATNNPATGQVCDATHNTACCGRLNAAGRPVLNDLNGTAIPSQVYSSSSFSQWYADVPSVNVNIPRLIKLAQVSGSPASYAYDSTVTGVGCGEAINNGGFFPLDFLSNFNGSVAACVASDTVGWGDQGGNASHNYGFTSELRFFFQYAGGEKLDFFGDDDFFVYVNGRLAVDLGGVHGQLAGSVLLGDTNGSGVLDAAELSAATDGRFSITKGEVYEIAVLRAERNEFPSNYKLTLANFAVGHSVCTPLCGDGVITPGEACDNGDAAHTSCASTGTCNSDTSYGGCSTSCTWGGYCGDGIPQTASSTPSGPEECDDGLNVATYGQPGCGPGCMLPPHCGDGKLDQGEECDRGASNQNGLHGGCSTTCRLNAFCGDGTVDNPTEDCDDGVNAGGYGFCSPGCTWGMRCGDGITQTAYGEECDDGPLNGQPGYCTSTCGKAGYCGDHNVEPARGETCDDGKNDGSYGSCTRTCEIGPRCGDGFLDAEEACDHGADNQDGLYGGCSTTCRLDGYCGDGNVDSPTEECDDGVNVGGYGFCGSDCKWGPRCGDGVTDDAYGEQCDDGALNGQPGHCTATCAKRGFCGDGIVEADLGETCDDGKDDGSYGSCTRACETGPRCGDGFRDAEEACDNGADDQDGVYGGCSTTCTSNGTCGDGIVQTPDEECDDGLNLGGYGFCAAGCRWGERCGDGVTQAEFGEQCDDGSQNGQPGRCTLTCGKPGYCGDGVVQQDAGETCDDGTNDGRYGGCTRTCQRAPRCGDGIVQADRGEQCDSGTANASGAYGGCSATCALGPRCGDGVLQSPYEECDDGPANGNNSPCSLNCRRQVLVAQ